MEVTQPAQRIPPRPPGGQRARACVCMRVRACVCVCARVRARCRPPPAGDAAVPRAVLPLSVPSSRRAHDAPGSAPQPRNGSGPRSPPPAAAAAGRAVPGADGQRRPPLAAPRGTPSPGLEGGGGGKGVGGGDGGGAAIRSRRPRPALPHPTGPAPGARGPAAPLGTEPRRSPRPVRPPPPGLPPAPPPAPQGDPAHQVVHLRPAGAAPRRAASAALLSCGEPRPAAGGRPGWRWRRRRPRRRDHSSAVPARARRPRPAHGLRRIDGRRRCGGRERGRAGGRGRGEGRGGGGGGPGPAVLSPSVGGLPCPFRAFPARGRHEAAWALPVEAAMPPRSRPSPRGRRCCGRVRRPQAELGGFRSAVAARGHPRARALRGSERPRPAAVPAGHRRVPSPRGTSHAAPLPRGNSVPKGKLKGNSTWSRRGEVLQDPRFVCPVYRDRLFSEGTRRSAFKLTGQIQIGAKEEVLYTQGGGAVAQAAQRGGAAPSLQTAEVREWGSEHCWSCGCPCSEQAVGADGL